MKYVELAGTPPAGSEPSLVDLGLFVFGSEGSRTKALALDRVAQELRAASFRGARREARPEVLAERDARPEDIAACYTGLDDPDARARVRFRLKLLLGMAEEEEGPLPDAFWVEALGGRRDVERMARDMERLGLFGPEGGRDGRR